MCTLAYKVVNDTYLLNDFLNHRDVRHQIQLRINGDLRLPLYATTPILNTLFVTEPSILRMAYQVTYAAYHHSVLLRIDEYSSICAKYSFPKCSSLMTLIIK